MKDEAQTIRALIAGVTFHCLPRLPSHAQHEMVTLLAELERAAAILDGPVSLEAYVATERALEGVSPAVQRVAAILGEHGMSADAFRDPSH